MRRAVYCLAALAVLCVSSVWADEVVWEDVSGGNIDICSVLASEVSPQEAYFGSGSGIFRSRDKGKSWKRVFSVNDRLKKVNYLLESGEYLYAATGCGLYRSSDKGNSWKKVFKGKNSFERECTSVAVLPYGVYLGTRSGLFFSKDNSQSWHKGPGVLANACVLAIGFNIKEPARVYVACVEGVFRTQDSGKTWERVFSAYPAENGGDSEETDEDRDEEERFSDIRYISVDLNDPSCLYLATADGVYKSTDAGQRWEPLNSYGLLSKDVRSVSAAAGSGIFCATKSGVFRFLGDRWEELSFGLTAQDIRSLAFDKEGIIYAACDSGLFRAQVTSPASFITGGSNMLQIYLKGEPDIASVQEAAVKYAEVEPEKIILWRKQAAKKAILPQISLGFDRNTTDLWHWESGSTTKPEDDTLRRGDDSLDWDISLSWDLSELIWTNDQTSIDARSRLLVQLRNDILDEVTKLYFERVRLMSEIDNLNIEDRKIYFEKSLRLGELTASLDALTGGYFSKAKKAISGA